jgi:pimeloyl-ACP methyl ester carboxylesterase
MIAPVTKLIKAGEVDLSITRFGQGVLGKQALDRLPEDFRAHMRANASTHVGQALADGGFEPITEPQIASVTTPALVITGVNSPAIFRRLAGLLASLLPNSRTVNVPTASHAMHCQNPTAVNDAVLRFLANVTD